MSVLKEAARLHALGFAVHWCREKSKAPVEAKWTSGERKPWPELKRSYRPGYNLGVRLGNASKVGPYYLAVIDCDVKSREKKHLDQLEDKLFELFGEKLADAPVVMSGRGNGSKHIYIRTKVPVAPQRLAQSFDDVEVHMPSVKASKRDRERLSSLKIEKGIRMRAAWEISLMGEGQQVVLPPSIHPDSGRHYIWAKPYKVAKSAPQIEVGSKDTKSDLESKDTKLAQDWEPEEVFLEVEDVPKRVVALIKDGEGCDDRSAGLFSAALSLCSAGLSDQQILSVLTDRQNYLGLVAYEHTQSPSRRRAAEWIRRFTLAKARRETSLQRKFERLLGDDALDVEEGPRLDHEAAQKQAEEIKAELKESIPWQRKLERTYEGKGPPKGNFKNMLLILENAVGEKAFRHDLFFHSDRYGCETPWGGKVGEELRDIDLIEIKRWCVEKFKMEPKRETVLEAVQSIAHRNAFHPIRDWLNGLPEWDGIERCDTWIKRLMGGTGPEAYMRAISRKVLVAMIARVFRPGVKFDYVLTLIGKQGVRKSTSLVALAHPWGSDAHMDIGNKDGVLAMRGAWALELGEMSSFSKAEVERVKEFISRPVDRIRTPYGKLTENFPRQCVFIGTTNNTEYLKDETGNRRFWPVVVKYCDVEAIAKEREQLFAEAMVLYTLGEKLYLEGDEEVGALEVQARHMEHDSLEDDLMKFFKTEKIDGFDPKRFQLNDLFSNLVVNGRYLSDDRATQVRVGKCLRKLGWDKRVLRVSNGHKGKYWVKIGGATL